MSQQAQINMPLPKEEIEQAFQSENTSMICGTLVALALMDDDWKKVQSYCYVIPASL